MRPPNEAVGEAICVEAGEATRREWSIFLLTGGIAERITGR